MEWGTGLNAGVLNAADYGVPQNRRRAVIIGKRDGEAPALPIKTGHNPSTERGTHLSARGKGEANYAYAIRNMSINKVGKQYAELYEELADRHQFN